MAPGRGPQSKRRRFDADGDSSYRLRRRASSVETSPEPAEEDSPDESSDSNVEYPPQQYIGDQVTESMLYQTVHRFRRAEWPSTPPESLSWLTEMSEYAKNYHNAYTLMATGCINKMLTMFFKSQHTFNISENLLMLLVLQLCLRCKEAREHTTPYTNFYAQFLLDLLKHPIASHSFAKKLNARYEFNGPTIEALMPLLRSAFFLSYAPQTVGAEHFKSTNSKITAQLDQAELLAHGRYQTFVADSMDHAAALWTNCAFSAQRFDEKLELDLGYPPTVASMVFSCLSIILPDAIATKYLPLSVCGLFKYHIMRYLEVGTSPHVYYCLTVLAENDLLKREETNRLMPRLSGTLDTYLAITLNDEEVDAYFKLNVHSQLDALRKMPKKLPPPVLKQLVAFAQSTKSHDLTSLIVQCIWHIISTEVPSAIPDTDDVRLPSPLRKFLGSINSSKRIRISTREDFSTD